MNDDDRPDTPTELDAVLADAMPADETSAEPAPATGTSSNEPSDAVPVVEAAGDSAASDRVGEQVTGAEPADAAAPGREAAGPDAKPDTDEPETVERDSVAVSEPNSAEPDVVGRDASGSVAGEPDSDSAAPDPEPRSAESEAGEPGAVEPGAVEQDPAELDRADSGDTAGEPVPVGGSELPDLTQDADFQGAVEALLLVVDSPIEVEALADALEEPVARTQEVLERLADRYAETGSGIDLRRTGGGWRFYTRDRFAPFVEKLLLDGQRAKLTRAALETLAVIAYRQPVTRARVAAVRGVNVDGVVRTLLARGLIEESGTDADTGGFLYRTTELFLERLGLSSLEDLPSIAPLLPEVDAIDDV